MIKWEYSCTAWTHRLGDDFAVDVAQKRLDSFGDDGWELVQIYRGLAYFKRYIIKEKNHKRYTYESVQDGYVIFGPDGRKIPGWDVEKLLNHD